MLRRQRRRKRDGITRILPVRMPITAELRIIQQRRKDGHVMCVVSPATSHRLARKRIQTVDLAHSVLLSSIRCITSLSAKLCENFYFIFII